MTNTGQTLESLKTFREDVKLKMLNRDIVSFNIGSISIDNDKMSVNNDELSETAMKKVLAHLRVKNNFLGIGKKLSPSDWTMVKEKLKSATANQIVHARKLQSNGKPLIDDIYMAAPKSTGLLEIDSIFEEVISSVIGTAKDLSLKQTYFLEDKDEVNITFLEHDSEIDIFGNGEDMWKVGKRVVWNGMNFSIAPFFERLVCANGNTAPQFGFRANISNNKFNINRIKNILEKEITLESESMDKHLTSAAGHLKENNLSIREFLKFKGFFNEKEHEAIIKKWLDDSYLNRAYGYVVADMPAQWQCTADTGKNAYDFFNDLTYIASHPAEAIMSDRERVQLQIKASDLLFQKQLDLENLAPTLDWVKINAANAALMENASIN